MKRIIFHIDVNSAFLSWTAVKMVQEGQPDIRLVPSVVSGDPNDRRSIISAASIPAKKVGIKTAQPLSMAMRICPTLVVVGGDWEWYKRCSDGFIEICRSYSSVLQQFSIDECFIDMSFRCYGKDPVEVATQLKDEVKTKLGFTVKKSQVRTPLGQIKAVGEYPLVIALLSEVVADITVKVVPEE